MDPYSDVNKRPTVFDGHGNVTEPDTVNHYYDHNSHSFKTAHYWINRRWITMHALFFTQNGGYDASYTLGRKDTVQGADQTHKSKQLTSPHREKMFRQALLGFDTDNEGSKQIPTMSIYLVGYRSWEQILSVNDYVAIQVEEQYPDQPYWDASHANKRYDHNGIERRTLMCGLISDIRETEDSQSKGRFYIVTCQGMQKILNDINLGLPETARQGGVNLLFDINGESNPANETFPFGNISGGGATKSSSSGNAKETGDQREKEFISWCNSHGCSKNQTAGLMGNAVVEAGVKPNDWSGGTNNWFGLSKGGVGVHVPSNVSVTDYLNYTILHKGSYSFPNLSECPSGFYSYRSKTKSSSPYKCADWWCDNVEHTQASNGDEVKGEDAEACAKEIS